MVKQFREVVVEKYVDVDGYPIDDCIAELQKLKEKHEYKFSKLKLEYQDDYDDVRFLVLVGTRLETDSEEQLRLGREKRNEDWQRHQYEQLKKKFEGN